MKASVVITVLNEENTIANLLNSLLAQDTKANEILVVDGGSNDKTVQVVSHYQKKYRGIRLIQESCTRARGRNLGVEMAGNEIIVTTDAGCVANKYWLGRILRPLSNEKIDMVAGFYKMRAKSSFKKALAYFLGVTPGRFTINFLPSARSLAFKRGLWDRVGGFPQGIKDTAEDMVFNYKALKEGANIARMKNAYVYWDIPENLSGAFKKMYKYARGNAKSKIIWKPKKGLASHNIDVLFVFFRYLIAFAGLVYSFKYSLLALVLMFGLIMYILYSFRKVYIDTKDIKSGLWAVVLQFTSDIAVMSGFVAGIIGR